MKKVIIKLLGLACFAAATAAFADASTSGAGIGAVAHNVTTNLGNIAKLITGAAFVAGMAFIVGAIIKFKAHKDNPTQIPIGTPIALLFVGAALMFVPSIFDVLGKTILGTSGTVGGVSGVSSFKTT